MPVEVGRTALGSKRVNCKLHGDFTSNGSMIRLGKISNEIWTKCPACASAQADSNIADANSVLQQRQHQALASAMRRADIPKRFIGKMFENYASQTADQVRAVKLVERYAVNFSKVLETGQSLLLQGGVGTGKTHLACAVLQHIMPEHAGVYTTMMDLVRRLRAGWGGKAGNDTQALSDVGSLPLLVIDEIGVQFGSEGERIHLHDVLDKRYRDMLPTILITNASDADLQRFVGDRIYDRLNEMCYRLNFDWTSHRTTGRSPEKLVAA